MLLAAVTLSLAANAGLHPRPAYDQQAAFARWLVHESDYATVSTMHAGKPFGNIVSVSDGDGTEHSTGIIYTYPTSRALIFVINFCVDEFNNRHVHI